MHDLPIPAWQHPFVNVFRTSEGAKRVETIGDVQPVLDKIIGKRVYRMQGKVTSANFLRMPPHSKEYDRSLGLTGQFCYVQMRSLPDEYFVVYLEVAVDSALAVRISFGNLFKKFHYTPTSIQIPCPDLTRWTVLVFDLKSIVKKFCGRKFECLKSVQFCANCYARNVITSDESYGPKNLPRDMTLPIPKGTEWVDSYTYLAFRMIKQRKIVQTVAQEHKQCWTKKQPVIKGEGEEAGSPAKQEIPRVSPKKATPRKGKQVVVVPNEAVVFDANKSAKPKKVHKKKGKKTHRKGKEKKSADVPAKGPAPVVKQTSFDYAQVPKQTSFVAPVDKAAQLGVQPPVDPSLGQTTGTKDPDVSPLPASAVPNPAVSPDSPRTPEKLIKPDAVAGPKWEEEMVGVPEVGQEPAEGAPPQEYTGSPLAPISTKDPRTGLKMIELQRVLGFATGLPRSVLWSPAGPELVYAIGRTVVLANATDGTQRFLVGHTQPVSGIAVAVERKVIATIQSSGFPQVCLWHAGTGELMVCLGAHHSNVSAVALSHQGDKLCVVGRDSHARQALVIYDIGCLWEVKVSKKPEDMPILARQYSEFAVNSIRFLPHDSTKLVSCGAGNIRWWRLYRESLRGLSLQPQSHSKAVFTDVAFERGVGHFDAAAMRIFVSTDGGSVLQIALAQRVLEFVYQLHAGKAIHSIDMNEGFCVTGAEDGLVRVWPLDFSDYFLEAEHDGAISSVCISNDGLRVAAATTKGSMGVLDVPTHNFQTLMRCHREAVVCTRCDPHNKEFVTSSVDGSISVWDMDTFDQMYEFVASNDVAGCIAYHPTAYVFVAGFESGFLRIFDIAATAVLEEYCQHVGAVLSAAFSLDGTRLVSAAADGYLCIYDVEHHYQPIRMLPDTCSRTSPCLNVSGKMVAAIGPDDKSIVFVDLESSQHKMTLRSKDNSIFSRFAFAGQGVVALTQQRKLQQFSLQTGEIVAEIQLPEDIQTSSALALTGDGRYVFTSGPADTLLIQPMDFSLPYVVIGACNEPITEVQFSPDSKLAIGLGRDSICLYIWEWFPGAAADISADIETLIQKKLSDQKKLAQDAHKDLSDLEYTRPSDVLGPDARPPRPAVRAAAQKPLDEGWELKLKASLEEGQGVAGDMLQGKISAMSDNFKKRMRLLTTPSPPAAAPVTVVPEASEVVGKVVERVAVEEPKIPDGDLSKTAAFIAPAPKPMEAEEHKVLPLEEKIMAPPQTETEDLPVEVAETAQVPEPVGVPDTAEVAETVEVPLAEPEIVAPLIRECELLTCPEPTDEAPIAPALSLGYSGTCSGVVWHRERQVLAVVAGQAVVLEDIQAEANEAGRRQKHLVPLDGKEPKLLGMTTVSGTGKLLAVSALESSESGCFDVYVYDLGKDAAPITLPFHASEITGLAFLDGDRHLVSTDASGAVIVWDLDKAGVYVSAQHNKGINALSAPGWSIQEFVTACDGCLTFWLVDIVHGRPQLKFLDIESPADNYTSVGWDMTGRSLVLAGASNGRVTLWNAQNNALLYTWMASSADPISGVLLLGAGGIAAAHHGSSLSVFSLPETTEPDPSTTAILKKKLSFDGQIVAQSFDADTREGVVATDAGCVYFVSLVDYTVYRLVSGHEGGVVRIMPTETKAGHELYISVSRKDVVVWTPGPRFQIVVRFRLTDVPGRVVAAGVNVHASLLAVVYDEGTVDTYALKEQRKVAGFKYDCEEPLVDVFFSGENHLSLAFPSHIEGYSLDVEKGVFGPMNKLECPSKWHAVPKDRMFKGWERAPALYSFASLEAPAKGFGVVSRTLVFNEEGNAHLHSERVCDAVPAGEAVPPPSVNWRLLSCDAGGNVAWFDKKIPALCVLSSADQEQKLLVVRMPGSHGEVVALSRSLSGRFVGFVLKRPTGQSVYVMDVLRPGAWNRFNVPVVDPCVLEFSRNEKYILLGSKSGLMYVVST